MCYLKKTFCFLSLFFLAFQKIPLENINTIADGLNIEGGTIGAKHLKENQIWANICMVLDRPFIDGQELIDITNSNTYLLKESSLKDYNEAQVNYTLVTIYSYYLTHLHNLIHKPSSEKLHLMVQVHRNSSGAKYLDHLFSMFNDCLVGIHTEKKAPKARQELHRVFYPDLNTEVSFCYGTNPAIFAKQNVYETVDCVLSISMISGFRNEWPASSFVIPQEFIPFSLTESKIFTNEKYSSLNHLSMVINHIVKNQSDDFLKIVNEKFRSTNCVKKAMSAEFLKSSDFKRARLVQVEKNFNPSQLPKEVIVN
ncbi:MAG: hypothetical protein JHC93_07540 [Parachlamydiales bacterium]|nr:hypothetical protein [Parachlamydiales bacterium]